MKLRKVAEHDLERVRELRNENREWFFDSSYLTAEQQQKWFKSKPDTFTLFVIEEDEKIVGTIGLKEFQDEIEVGNLTMDRNYRGRGLMKMAIKQLTSDGRKYFANVLPHNENSLKLFEKSGFLVRNSSVEMVVLFLPGRSSN